MCEDIANMEAPFSISASSFVSDLMVLDVGGGGGGLGCGGGGLGGGLGGGGDLGGAGGRSGIGGNGGGKGGDGGGAVQFWPPKGSICTAFGKGSKNIWSVVE